MVSNDVYNTRYGFVCFLMMSISCYMARDGFSEFYIIFGFWIALNDVYNLFMFFLIVA